MDFSHVIPRTQLQDAFQAAGNTFKVIFDKNRQTLYGINGELDPYHKDSTCP